VTWILAEATLAAIATVETTTLAATEATAATTATLTAAEAATTLAAAEAATLATTEATASGAVFLRTGFIDGQLTTTELNAVGLFSGILSLLGGAHGHERETTRTAGHTVKGDVNVGNGTELLEVCAQLFSRGLERQVADVQFGTLHVMIS
jgi:hypothetical protein